uniref:phosphopyruvate hydratase n=1 Tax=Sphaeramia orbicularis TaxID=375764 RepID=A0A672YRK1_9TELE
IRAHTIYTQYTWTHAGTVGMDLEGFGGRQETQSGVGGMCVVFSLSSGKKASVPDKPFPAAEQPLWVLPGSLAIGSVSLAVAKAAAEIQRMSLRGVVDPPTLTQTLCLYFLLPQMPSQIHVPVSLVTLMSCGRTSPGKLNLLEEIILVPKAGQRVRQVMKFLCICPRKHDGKCLSALEVEPATLSDRGAPMFGYDRAEQPLDLINEACSNLGLQLGSEIHLVLNCAAPELMDYSKGKYEVATRVFLSPDELVDMYHTLISKYPAVVALIDPLRREDAEQWEKLNHLIGRSCALLSDVTYKPQGPPPPGVKGHILKHMNEVSVSDLIDITSQKPDHITMFKARYGCPLSVQAVGLGLDYIKLGGLSGSERMSQYNRLMTIEEELDQLGTLGTSVRPFTEGAEPRGEALDLPVSLRSYPHLWS